MGREKINTELYWKQSQCGQLQVTTERRTVIVTLNMGVGEVALDCSAADTFVSCFQPSGSDAIESYGAEC
jgi:hypothetical protein